MSRKLTYQEVKDYIESFDYKLLSKEYIDNKTKLQLQCPKGHIIEIRYNDFKKGVRCKMCSSNYHPKFTYEYVKEYIENENYELLSKEYINANSNITVVCPHGHRFETRFGRFKNGARCQKCHLMNNNLNTVHSYEYVKEQLSSEGYNLLSTEYTNAHDKILIECPKGHRFETKYNAFQQGNRCPHCNESKGEREISQILCELNIEYIKQYRFEDCKFKYTLPFDFCLPKYNILIEYDGELHYKVSKHHGGLDRFIDTKIRDTVKNEYCKKNNIKLIRIPYWEFNNIKEIIINELKLK